MGKKEDLSDFERGMVVGFRRAGLSISKTADLLGFSRTTISRVYIEWSEKEKISSERRLCGRKCLVDVRGQRRMNRQVRDDRKANSNSNNHSSEYHLWTHNTSKAWSRWATAAEDHTGCRFCQLRTGNEGYNSHRLTKKQQNKRSCSLSYNNSCSVKSLSHDVFAQFWTQGHQMGIKYSMEGFIKYLKMNTVGNSTREFTDHNVSGRSLILRSWMTTYRINTVHV